VKSPLVRKIYHDNDPGNYFCKRLRFEGKTIYQADFLFDPYATVLTKEGNWETNLQRMKEGRCPIGHAGITNENDRNLLSKDVIRTTQNRFRIELHHLTQKDTGMKEDPLCEMTQAAHMGKNSRVVVEFNPETDTTLAIIHSSLEKEAAVALCESNQFIVTNTLHFRTGDSLIPRSEFDVWRIKYWKNRAVEIEKGDFTGKDNLPTFVIQKKLFDDIEKVDY
jgi:hypothetical protein